jgi:hypothetical protein
VQKISSESRGGKTSTAQNVPLVNKKSLVLGKFIRRIRIITTKLRRRFQGPWLRDSKC